MTRRFNFLCAFVLSFLFVSVAFAQQNTNVTNITNIDVVKNKDQHKEWQQGKNKFPSKPKDMWEIGVHGGYHQINGDVNHLPSWGVGGHIRKSLGYVFALRLNYVYGRPKGLNYLPNYRGVAKNSVLGRAPYNYGPDKPYFYNYEMTYHEAALQGILTLNNLKFHKERNKWDLFAIAGLGGNLYQTRHDALNSGRDNATYDEMRNILDFQSDDRDGRRGTKDKLKTLLDGEYETVGEQWGYLIGKVNKDDSNLAAESKRMKLNPIANLGLGLGYKLSRRITLTLEHQATFNDDDLLDGYRWAEQGDFTRDVDVPHYTNLRLNLHLGSFKKRVEPLWWLNPLNAPYEQIAANTRKPDAADMMKDEDDDGVPDILDKEPNTPADCPVDTRGVTLDSDADGVPDCEDKEPFSPPGYPVDNDGIAQLPEAPEALSEADVTRIGDSRYCTDCGRAPVVAPRADWFLPMIHFDLNKYCIKSEYYPQLHHVATIMKKYPDVCVEVKGHTDARNNNDYNQVLSYNRALEAVDYLVGTYGIDRGRLSLRYGGEETALIKGSNKESSHYMNRRVEFTVVQDCGASSGRPAGPEAGVNCSGRKRSVSTSTGGYIEGGSIKR